jgi:hypothetical protein
LKSIFGSGQGSANDDLSSFLHDRYSHSTGAGEAKPMMIGNRAMPCSLEGTNRRIAIPSPPSAATNALVRQLAMSEYVLRTDPARQALAITSLENALNALSGFNRQDADWSPAYYADLGVKASLRLGNAPQARAILLRGLQLEPDSDQLAYLSRILAREMGTKN